MKHQPDVQPATGPAANPVNHPRQNPWSIRDAHSGDLATV